MQFLAKTKMDWLEPRFFVHSQRTPKEWLRELAMPLSVYVFLNVLFLVIGFEWWKVLPSTLVVFALQLCQLESVHFRRLVWIDEESIAAFGSGNGHCITRCRLDAIEFAEVIPSTSDRVSKLIICAAGEFFQVGIPETVDLQAVAQLLFNFGVPVHMQGWEPTMDPEWVADEQEYRNPLAQFAEVASVSSIPEQQQNLTPSSTQLLCNFVANMSFWMLGAAALCAVMMGVGIFIVDPLLINTTTVAPVLLVLAYLLIPACRVHLRWLVALANRHIRKVARTQVLARAESLIRHFDERVYFVDVLDPANCQEYYAKPIDFGFLTTDGRKSRIVFEGNGQRWSIPFTAVLRCNVGQIETRHQSQAGPVRCLVELEFDCPDGPRSVALRIPNLYLGNYTDELRLEHAVQLHTELTANLPRKPHGAQTSASTCNVPCF